jgi:hypothetical protein
MKTYLDCIPCFVRQALASARLVSNDENVHEQVLRKVLTMVADMDLTDPPPRMGQRMHRAIREVLGNPDPYRAIKARFTAASLRLVPEMQKKIAASPNPLETAVRLAIAGNLIDFGPRSDVDESEIEPAVSEALSAPLLGEVEPFRRDLKNTRSLLYLADNAGEIVFDKLLIEQIRREVGDTIHISVVVKGSPTINDAVREDAEAAGIQEVAELLDNGSDAPGTILPECRPQVRQRFEAADMVVAKGQGNYETLNTATRPIWFLLKAKCPIISRDVPCAQGSMVLRAPRSEAR